MNFSAVILAAGKSSRMGRDKAFMEIGGQILLARQIEIVRAAGATEVFISGRADADYSAFGCHVLKDNFPDAGPLAGIEAALAAATNPLLLVLAVDLPEMRPDFLRRLATRCTENSGVVPRVGNDIEPLAAFYPRAAHTLVETQILHAHRAARAFAASCVLAGLASFVNLPAEDVGYLANWNSVCDLRKLADRAAPN